MMDEKNVEEAIKKTLKIVKTVPDEFRLTTYELVLPMFLGVKSPSQDIQTNLATTSTLKIPTDVLVFLKTHSIPEDKIDSLYMSDSEGVVHPIYKLSTDGKEMAPFQIHVSLLMALDKAMSGEGFKISQKDVREKVKSLKIHDSAHFLDNFRSRVELYTKVEKDTDLELNDKGKDELATIIKGLLNESR